MRTVKVTKVGVSLLGPYLDSWTKVGRAPKTLTPPACFLWAILALAAGPAFGGANTPPNTAEDPVIQTWQTNGTVRIGMVMGLISDDFGQLWLGGDIGIMRLEQRDMEGLASGKSSFVPLQPHFWQTLWFQSLAGLALCAAAFAWHRRRMAELQKRHTTQENFTRQLLFSQENERKRVASELHDGLGQDLLLIKNRVALLASRDNHTPETARQLKEISTDASRAIADVRSISHALRPSALEQVGFTRAVEWMLENIGEATTIKFSSELDDIDGLLGSDKEINLYRIIQEGLNNVLKHSQASRVLVEIKRRQSSISVSIFDDGKGFAPTQSNGTAGRQPSFGLTGMKERAKVLGGVLILQSAPGAGTRLTLNLPLSHNGN